MLLIWQADLLNKCFSDERPLKAIDAQSVSVTIMGIVLAAPFQ